MNPARAPTLTFRMARERLRAQIILLGNFILVALIAFADHRTGYPVRLAILYLVPIAWTTWRLGGVSGTIIAVAASLSWLITFQPSNPYSDLVYFYLEAAVTGATFLVIVGLLARLHRALERSDARLITVLEDLDAAVHVEARADRTALYENRRFRETFGGGRRFAQDAGEIYDEGTDAWYLLQSRPLRWTDGRDAVLRILTDVTEERRTREAAHKASRLVALGGFASTVAHELNQPLAAIATYNDACLRLLQSHDTDVNELRAAMQKCREQARRAGAIIQRLREVLRQPAPLPTRVNLNETAHAVHLLIESEALEAGVQLEVREAGLLCTVHTDRLLVEQVALNLVRNAIEAVQDLPSERRCVTITVSEQTNNRVALTVSDYGDGVQAQVQERLFEAFVTTKAHGLGLGLSICRSVIESLGGSIEHRSGTGGGAEFSFSFPATDR